MTNRLGGQVGIYSAPHRGDMGAITNYLADELERLDVAVHLRTFVEPDLVDELRPDVLMSRDGCIATGATGSRRCDRRSR